MTSVFTGFVRSLEAGGKPPDIARFDELLETLRRALVYEMKKRSLWRASPTYLGIYGGNSWTEGDLFEEILLDCYQFIFIRRLPGLQKQLLVRSNLDGLIFLNIRNFLHDRQKRHDPLGFRIFEVLQTAVLRMLDGGLLHVLDGDRRVRNDTILGFSALSDPQAAGGDLRPWVANWNDQLLPELITAWNKEDILPRLEELIARLSERGVEVFRFRDLIEPLKDDARARWQAIQYALQRDGVGTAVERSGEELVSIVRWVRPERGFEERQSFRALGDCVDEGLERLEEREKTREYLRRLWRFLRDWAGEADSPAEEGPAKGLGDQDRVPADKRLGELLGIPRARIPGLKAILGKLIKVCREDVVTGASPHRPPVQARQGGTNAMNVKSRREQLRLQTGEVAARFRQDRAELSERRRESPRPGEAFVFAETRDLPVEWILLERDAAKQRALVVPVDDNPLRGSRDIATSDTADSAVHFRCGHGSWIDVGAFDPELRSGVFSSEALERARRKCAEIAAGAVRASRSEQEIDADPEYESWGRALTEAQLLLPGNPHRAIPEAPSEGTAATVIPIERSVHLWRDLRLGYALAAAFAVAAVGLSIWVGRLQSELSRPIVVQAAIEEVVFLDPDRPVERPALTATPTHLSVFLVLTQAERRYATYRVKLVEPNGDFVWQSDVLATDHDILLTLPRRLLSSGEYRFQLYGLDGEGAEELLDEQDVRIHFH